MNITQHQITKIDQVNVGDTVVVVDSYRGRTTSVKYAEVTRKLKTKFELSYSDTDKVEYSSRIVFGHLKRYGAGADLSYGASSTYMYPTNDEVVGWCVQEKRKVTANRLRSELADLTSKNRNDEAGTEEALNTAREIAHAAQRLVDLEEEISKADHEAVAREEQEQEQEQDQEQE